MRHGLKSLCVLALAAGCGGAAAHTAPRVEVGRRVVDVDVGSDPTPAPLGAFDRTVADPEGETEDWPAPQPGVETAYFFVEGRLIGESILVDGFGVHPAARTRLLRPEAHPVELTAGAATGHAELSKALPAEMAHWLAVLNLYRNLGKEPRDVVERRGFGKMGHMLQSGTKDREDSTGSATLSSATRDVAQFLLAPGVLCGAQAKIFSAFDLEGDNPAQAARDRTEATESGVIPEWRMREMLGLERKGRGEFLFHEVGRVEDGQAVYELKMHLSNEVDSDRGESERFVQVFRCRSPNPIFAREIGGLRMSLMARGPSWIVDVQPAAAATPAGGHE